MSFDYSFLKTSITSILVARLAGQYEDKRTIKTAPIIIDIKSLIAKSKGSFALP